MSHYLTKAALPVKKTTRIPNTGIFTAFGSIPCFEPPSLQKGLQIHQL